MSIWGKLIGTAGGFALGGPIGALLGSLAGHAIDKFNQKQLPEDIVVKQIGFTIGVIALSAKMAKADGKVTKEEIIDFKKQIIVPENEIKNIGKIWDQAKSSTHGFDLYASQLANLFKPKSQVLEQVIYLLFNIAISDGKISSREIDYLKKVSLIFGFNVNDFKRIKSYYSRLNNDPYKVLGVNSNTPIKEIKKKWVKMAKEIHPDKLIGSGIPREFVEKNTRKLQEINSAWEEIKKS